MIVMWDSQHERNRWIRGTAEEVKGIRVVEIPSVLHARVGEHCCFQLSGHEVWV